MARLKLDTTVTYPLSATASSRLAGMSEVQVEAMAHDALGEHESSLDAELDAAVAARRLRRIRETHKLTQAAFSQALHVPLATVRDWEQARRAPEAAALALITVFEHEPEAVGRAFRKEADRGE